MEGLLLLQYLNTIVFVYFYFELKQDSQDCRVPIRMENIEIYEESESLDALYESLNPYDDAHF